MKSISIPQERALDQALIRILESLDKACRALGIPYLLTGAMAREILLVHGYGLPPGRATRDVDFGFQVVDWTTFETFSGCLGWGQGGTIEPIGWRSRMARQIRMDRSQFYQLLEDKGEADLKKILWELYWRGRVEVRERIEGILEPEAASRKHEEASSINGELALDDIEAFTSLVRSGAYMGGTRDVSRQERSKWRVTFRIHVENASGLLKKGDLECGLPAMEHLIDLLCEMGDYNYVHSEDPVQASGIVVSDRVELLWRTILERDGFPALVQNAPAQLIRWESPYGWTRTGTTRLCEKERTLAEVLQTMIKGPDAWLRFTDAYLEALDKIPRKAKERSLSWSLGWNSECAKRSRNLANWHECLHYQLRFGEGGDRLFRVAAHPALAGPEADFFLARLCSENGQPERAKDLMGKCLKELPGHQDFLEFAKELGVPMPRRA